MEAHCEYTTRQVARLTGATARQIQYWDDGRLIRPSAQRARGTGTRRLYSFDDVVAIRCLKEFLDAGVSLQKVRKAIAYLKREFAEVERPLADLWLVTDGKRIFHLEEGLGRVVDVLREGQLCFCVSLGNVVAHIEKRTGRRPGRSAHAEHALCAAKPG